MSKRFKRLFSSTLLIVLSLCFVSAFGCSGKGDDNGGTNTQELAIDEGDIVKSVGNRIYKVQSDGVLFTKFRKVRLLLSQVFRIREESFPSKRTLRTTNSW